MPTYEYECEACKHSWEAEQRITAEPIKVCPECGKERAHRVISTPTRFVLAGRHWARDGYGPMSGPSFP